MYKTDMVILSISESVEKTINDRLALIQKHFKIDNVSLAFKNQNIVFITYKTL